MSERQRITFPLDELADGEMKTFISGETKLLVARLGNDVYALQGTCPHYGAELAKGALCQGRVICPWHHASFAVKGGAWLEPPALEGLKTYPVTVDGDTVTVTLEARPPEPPEAPPNGEGQTTIILGGGAAGFTAALELRRRGYRGRVVMLSSQARAPYDRPNVSKEFLAGQARPEWMPLRDADWYREQGIELRLRVEVDRVDVQGRTLHLTKGETLSYDDLIVATGGEPRELRVSGADLGHVETLRKLGDAEQLVEEAQEARKVVIVGASFIGMEGAASLMSRDDLKLHVTVVGREQVPFERTLGAEVGRALQALHEQRGVTFRLGAEVERFEGDPSGQTGAVSAVVLKGGERLEADVVLLGLGVRPATDMLPKDLLTERGEVRVDAHLRAAPHLYACGDIARFPDPHQPGDLRVEHWRVAEQHGRVAGANVAGMETEYRGVPFFWTQQYGESLRYVGHAEQWDETVTWGDVTQRDFLTFYVQGGQVRAASGMKRDAALAALEGLILMDLVPSVADLKAGEFDLRERLKPGKA